MVQPQPKAGTLDADDYLLPFTTLRNTVLRPAAGQVLSRSKVRLLLKYNVERLTKPWEPFKTGSSAGKAASLNKDTTALPGTDAKFDVDDVSRSIAKKLATETGLSELDAFVMWKSYASHSIEDPEPAEGQSVEDALLERLLLWYEEELLAVPQIVMALFVPASQPTGWEDVAAELRPVILGDQATFIENLFRAFSGLAQKNVSSSHAARALYWSTLQLRQQETLLDLLFLILYQFTTRPAAVSEGLVKGAVLSTFGTAQANREIWENDNECQRVQSRIRDLVLVIAVEALCLAQIVSPEGDQGDKFGATLLHSRDRIHAVHQFIMEQSEDLDGPEAHDMVFPAWPMPILCLAWAIALRSLPANLQPPSGDSFTLDTTNMDADEPVVYLGAASRALRLSSGLFPWLEVVLEGPLFEASKDALSGDLAVDMAALRRSPLKDLLIGLSELIFIDNVVDRTGLYRSWELLFGGGASEASQSLSNNYWRVDFVYDDRRAILDYSHFPREPTSLPRILSALTGVSSDDELDMSLVDNAVPDVFDYFTDLPFVTFVAPPGSFMVAGRDEHGKPTVEAAVDFELPGGVVIPRRTRGTVLSDEDDDLTIVSWRFRQPAWPLLIEILRGAAGFTPGKSTNQGVRRLSLVDLGVQGDLAQILSAGLKLIRCVLRSPDVATRLVTEIPSPGDRFPGHSLLELALSVASDRADPVAAKHAIDILQSLLLTGTPEIWTAFRASGVFDSHSRRQGSVASLIQSDARSGEHGLTVALLRLVRSIASANAGDAHVVRTAMKLIFTEVWSQFSGWRYRDVSKRYEIGGLLLNIFDIVLRHPLGEDAKSPSPAAAYLIEVFITGASPLTYKPIVDVFTQALPLAGKLIGSRRWTDAEIVVNTFDQSASYLATLVRIAPSLKVATTALPYSVFGSTIVLNNGDKVQLVDALFDRVFEPTLRAASLRLVIRLIKVYLETSALDAARPSLAGMLRKADETCLNLANLALNAGYNDIKPDAWALLNIIVTTQPGCAAFCVGVPKDGKVTGGLQMATEEVAQWKTLIREEPRALAAVLGYCQAVLNSPSASRGVAALRSDNDFWTAVYDISAKNVPLPSSLSENIATDVQDYSYTVQAKANGTALLAAELAHVIEADGPETKAQSLALSLFRNGSTLQDVAVGAAHSSCDPELHAAEDETLKSNGVQMACMRTICLPNERDYGVQYLYDGVPIIFNDPERQAAVTRSIAILNLNWSQLDADITLTKAWRLFAEVASTWTVGDGMATKSALRAAGAVASLLATEDRGGDVMLAIQTERLGILATLLETALDPEIEVADTEAIKELANNMRKIVESTLFSPILSLRHLELPPIHRPVLRMLLLLSQAKTGKAEDDVREMLFESAASFALEAADIVLDAIQHGTSASAEEDLALVVALLCEMSRVSTSTSVWLDKLQQVNLIPRSLEVIVRTRPVNNTLPAHFHTILLLHLAIASNSYSAEKLAVSGVLPAYSNNVVAVAAEGARIDASDNDDSLHRAWCGMLLVVKALLATLPNTASFARSDVVPFVRVVTPQLLHALAWNGETPISCPALDECELVVDVFYGLATAIAGVPGGVPGLFEDFALPALSLLAATRYTLSHPHRFCGLIVPATEEEQTALEKELETVEAQKEDVNLVDAVKLPTIAKRTETLISITRTTLATLVSFTHAWELLSSDLEPQPEYLLPYNDEHTLTASTDPVGVVNDLYLLLSAMSVKLTADKRGAVSQAIEATALLSLTQLLARRELNPHADTPADGDAMDVDAGSKRRASVSLGTPANRAASVGRELEADLRGMLSDSSWSQLLEVLRGVAVSNFAE